MNMKLMRKVKWAMGRKLVFAAAIATAGLAATSAPVSAIVMVDHFNSIAGGIGAVSGLVPAAAGTATLSYDPGISWMGTGSIGNTERLFAYGGFANTTISSNSNPSLLSISIAPNTAGSKAMLVLDGTTSLTAPGGDFTLTGNSLTNINYAGLGGQNLVQDANGIWLYGIAGSSISAGATFKLGFFRTEDDYAYFQWSPGGSITSDLFIPFTSQYGLTEAEGRTFQTVSSTFTLTEIFQSVNAVVLQVSNDSATLGGASLSLNAIYAHTPEPMSLISWAAFGLMGVMYRRRKPTMLAAEQRNLAMIV